MASKKQKKKEKKGSVKVTKKTSNKKEIAAIIVLLVCVIVVLSLFGQVGKVGAGIRTVMYGLFGGIASFVLVIYVAVLEICVLLGNVKKYFSVKSNIFLWCMVLFFVSFINTTTSAFSDFMSGSKSVIAYLFTMKPLTSGGLVGGGLSFLLQYYMEKPATLIVLAVFTIIFAMLFFSFSLLNIIKKVSGTVKKAGHGVSNIVKRFKTEDEKKQTEEEETETEKKKKTLFDFMDSKDEADEAGSENMPEENEPEDDDDEVILPPSDKDVPVEYAEMPITDEVPPPKYEDSDTPDFDENEDEEEKNGSANNCSASDIDADFQGVVMSNPNAKPYRVPDVSVLDIEKDQSNPVMETKLAQMSARKLEDVMRSFDLEVHVTNYSVGPTVTRYEMVPNQGIRVNRIKTLADDIALNMAATSVRIEAPIPGKSAIGIEIPNEKVRTVYFREIIESDAFRFNRSKLAVSLGKDISGAPVVIDLAKMPHLLIGGTTGSGKSVCTNGMLMSILLNASPNDVRMILIDPKVVEFSKYNGIPHLLLPVVTEPKKAAAALAWAVEQMEKRYSILAKYNVRDIGSYNAMAARNKLPKMPFIVIVIDELADLMMVARDSVETSINRIAQKARAAGMHLVLATQRPSVDVITGLIKSNIPSRIALKVSSFVDSKIIIDVAGAEKLLGRGDMLYEGPGEINKIRIQGAYVSDSDIEKTVNFIKETAEASYEEEVIKHVDSGRTDAGSAGDGNSDGLSEDEMLFRKAARLAVEMRQISASMLQRKFNLGYNRAARIIDMMEERGIISCKDGSNARKVLVDHVDFNDENE